MIKWFTDSTKVSTSKHTSKLVKLNLSINASFHVFFPHLNISICILPMRQPPIFEDHHFKQREWHQSWAWKAITLVLLFNLGRKKLKDLRPQWQWTWQGYACNDRSTINRIWKSVRFGGGLEKGSEEDRILDDFKVTILNNSQNYNSINLPPKNCISSNLRDGRLGERLGKNLNLKNEGNRN